MVRLTEGIPKGTQNGFSKTNYFSVSVRVRVHSYRRTFSVLFWPLCISNSWSQTWLSVLLKPDTNWSPISREAEDAATILATQSSNGTQYLIFYARANWIYVTAGPPTMVSSFQGVIFISEFHTNMAGKEIRIDGIACWSKCSRSATVWRARYFCCWRGLMHQSGGKWTLFFHTCGRNLACSSIFIVDWSSLARVRSFWRIAGEWSRKEHNIIDRSLKFSTEEARWRSEMTVTWNSHAVGRAGHRRIKIRARS